MATVLCWFYDKIDGNYDDFYYFYDGFYCDYGGFFYYADGL